jgi:hypothetical protein
VTVVGRILTAALLALLVAAGTASAGTYDVTTCSFPGPGGVNHAWSSGVFRLDGTPPTGDDLAGFELSGGCSSPEGYTLRSDTKSRHMATWATWEIMRFAAPSGARIVGLTLSRYSRVFASDSTASWERLSQLADGGPLGGPLGPDQCNPGSPPFPNPCTTGAPGRGANATVHYTLTTSALSLGIACGAPVIHGCWTSDGAGNPLAFLNFKAARVTISDTTRPTLSASGPLLAGGWRHPGDPVVWTARDNVGLRAGRLLLDGRQVGVDAPHCDYTFPAPCPQATARRIAIQTAVPDGRHTLQVGAVDAAGNQAVQTYTVAIDGHGPGVALRRPHGGRLVVAVWDRFSGVASASLAVRTRPSQPFRPLAARLVNGRLIARLRRGRAGRVGVRVAATDAIGNLTSGQVTTLALRVRRGRRSHVFHHGRLPVRYGHAVRLTGRLSTHDRQPLAGRRLALVARVRRTRARPRVAGAAITDKHGRFSFRLPAGPSRNLRLTYAGGADLLPVERRFSMRVGAWSTIHASRGLLFGRGRVEFSGRLGLRGARLPAGGKLIDLEAFDAGRWRVFATTRARGRHATWHASYTFSGRPGRYPVRVRIRREAAFPYDLGYSRAVVISVR